MKPPDAYNIKPSYENIAATCPKCGNETVFNRASDIKSPKKISRKNVVCGICGKEYVINMDRIDPAHIMFLENSLEFIKEKKYMNSVLSTCLAYECFFKLYLNVQISMKTFGEEEGKPGNNRIDSLKRMNDLGRDIENETKKLSFNPMRNIVLWHMLEFGHPHQSFEDARKTLCNLIAKSQKKPKNGKEVEISCKNRAEVFKYINETNINETRNKIAHKLAYRPTRDEAEELLEEAEKALEGSCGIFDLDEEINSYVRET